MQKLLNRKVIHPIVISRELYKSPFGKTDDSSLILADFTQLEVIVILNLDCELLEKHKTILQYWRVQDVNEILAGLLNFRFYDDTIIQ